MGRLAAADCLGKSCSFGLLCVYFVSVYQFVCLVFFPFVFEGGIWDLIVLILEHFLFNLCNIKGNKRNPKNPSRK